MKCQGLSHISPYPILPMGCLTYPKMMSSTSQTSPNTKPDSSQGPTEFKSPFMRDGVTLWVKSSTVYVLQWDERYGTTAHWNSDNASLAGLLNSRDLPNYLHTRPSSRHWVLSVLGLPYICLDSSVFKHLGNDFKVWISSVGLVTHSPLMLLPALVTYTTAPQQSSQICSRATSWATQDVQTFCQGNLAVEVANFSCQHGQEEITLRQRKVNISHMYPSG